MHGASDEQHDGVNTDAPRVSSLEYHGALAPVFSTSPSVSFAALPPQQALSAFPPCSFIGRT